MASPTVSDILDLLSEQSLESVSFDIDGTVYPILRVHARWFRKFLRSPREAWRFYQIRSLWEERRLGHENIEIREEDIVFFESFLTGVLDESLVTAEVWELLRALRERKIKVYFLTDHGARTKLQKLGLSEEGVPINCLGQCGELKPHVKIGALLSGTYGIEPRTHLHLGDRWTDEEQAKLFGCEFRYFAPWRLSLF